MKKLNIGIIGFGTVGNGLYNLLMDNANLILERTAIDVRIKSICDLRTDIIKRSTTNIQVTDKWQDIVEDDEIDLVVELIGGIEPAKSIIMESMKNGKNVVTANKKLLAEDGTDIFHLANTTKAMIGFEASVGGGIPCINALRYGLVGNKIRSISGILNGTTNYILSQMEEMDLSFYDALKDAQKKGFAETDPTFDIEGFDAGHKILLLSMIAYNKKIDFKKIPIEGITKIKRMDINYAKDMGYIIKLLGIGKLVDGELDIRVHPTMIHQTNPLASVRDEFNAVMFDGDMTDPVLLYGKGAGANPTASAIISDIIRIAERDSSSENSIIMEDEAQFLEPGNRISRYYLRITTEDRPGILSKISGCLGEYDISISSVIQKEMNEEYVPLIIMTHEAKEDDMIKAIDEIKKFPFVQGDTIIIRVEDI